MEGKKKTVNISKMKIFRLNIVSAYTSQLITVICAFVLPKLILVEYGSKINGLVASIQQFLIIFSFLSAGVGTVVQSSLYEPLAKKDNESLSRILVSAQTFFSKLGFGLIVYSMSLCFIYPRFINTGYSIYDVSLLIVALSIDTVCQYLFGITRNQLLIADQKRYIISFCSIISRLINTFVCVIMIKMHVSIQTIKFTTAFIFLFDPLVQLIYVRKHYIINWKIKYVDEPIKQKWNGIAQHLSTAVFYDTDILLLTIFSSLAKVSVYSVYNLVLNGINQFVSIVSTIVQPLLGEYWAKKEQQLFIQYFGLYEWVMSTITEFIYGCSLSLILPFVLTYTSNVYDTDYNVPLFAYIITLSGALQFLGLTYRTVIGSLGLYKETQASYIIGSILNLLLSLSLVIRYDLVGIAIGTLTGSLYMLVSQGRHIYKHVLKVPTKVLFIKLLKTLMILMSGTYICSNIIISSYRYLFWCIVAFKHACIWALIIIIVNILFDRHRFTEVFHLFRIKKNAE